MDSDSTGLTNKDTDTCADSVCPMDIASQSQAQNMDMSQGVDSRADESAELKLGENCNPSTENKPSELSVPCQSAPTSSDVEMQCVVGESSQRMETGSQENADSHEGECSVVQKEINEKILAPCQSLDESKTTDDGLENEALTGADNAELTDDNEKLFLESSPPDIDFLSSGATPTSGKNVHHNSSFYFHFSLE